MDRPVVRDGALFLLRVVVGFIFVAGGWRALVIDGPAATAARIAEWGVPQPGFAVWIFGVLELVGGALVAAGIFTSVLAGLLGVATALTAYVAPLGMDVTELGYPLLMLAALIVLVVFGPGRVSFDAAL